MNKKGFTLVELLAVIAILAILVIIALPNVMGMFNQAKENSYKTELKEIAKVAEQTWMSESMFNTGDKTYVRCATCTGKQLDLSGRTELSYYIKINKSGKIVKFTATDGTYQYDYSGNGLDPNDIKNVEQVANLPEDSKIEIKNNRVVESEVVPDINNRLMQVSGGSETTNFLRTNVQKQNIEKIIFANTISGHTANGTDCFDVSQGNNGSVLAWVTDSNSNGLKEITIGANGKVYAYNGSFLFQSLTNVTAFNNMEYFRESSGSMTRMFQNCEKLTNIDVSNFNAPYIMSMDYMFSGCSNLTSIDLSTFDTKDCNNMEWMFAGCTGLTTLDLSNINTRGVQKMQSMFAGCTNLRTIYASDLFVTSAISYTSTLMFDGCTSLVGGSGTTYASSRRGYQYAHIDGGTSNPGYFTRK